MEVLSSVDTLDLMMVLINLSNQEAKLKPASHSLERLVLPMQPVPPLLLRSNGPMK